MCNEGSLKPNNKQSNPFNNIISGSTNAIPPDSQEEDDVFTFILYFYEFFICACYPKIEDCNEYSKMVRKII